MSLSKKKRFEVFKRDGFQCMYCGRKPPDVILECDHIHPKSNGGKDEINNLITACFDCNRGKGARKLTALPEDLTEKRLRLQEKAEQFKEYNDFLEDQEWSTMQRVEDCSEYWELLTEDKYSFKDRFKIVTLKKFCTELPTTEIKEALAIAATKMDAIKNPEKATKYFCGICWNKIRANNND